MFVESELSLMSRCYYYESRYRQASELSNLQLPAHDWAGIDHFESNHEEHGTMTREAKVK